MIPKYRVWLKKEKKMVATDDIVNISFEDEEICVQTLYFEEGLISARDLDCYEFDEIELMQSTGIKDKAGNEIFEGDILITNAHASIVSFGKYTYFEDADTEVTEVGFYLSYLNVSPATYSPFEEFFWEKCQVIGNIHKNELDLIMYESWKFNKEMEDET